MSEPRPSAAMQDYLKAIYLLREEEETVSVASLAQRLGVAAPSVSSMVKRLHAAGLVSHSPYRGIDFTPAGNAAAVEIVRHHRLIELYLSQFLDIPWDRVHDEAELLEHVISEDLETRIAEKLGEPSVDPHGHPIPTYEGTVQERPTELLWNVRPQTRVVIARVSDRDPGLLEYLKSVDLIPGASAEVMEISPYSGTLTVRTSNGVQVIGAELARGIRVRVESCEPALPGALTS
ncbi:MAG: metal-dependent transcriptional regulator [Chloroflexota bacterium]